jgi:DNA polymerase III epsilon subunit-like protein
MNILVFDCETTGLINYKTHEYPYIVQLSWIVYSGGEFKENNYIIRPPISIPIESSNIHHITDELADEYGQPINEVLYKFLEDWKHAEYMIAHNLSFDLAIVKKELERNKIPIHDILSQHKTYFCTMKNSIDLCRIEVKSTREPNSTYFKYPKLIELFSHLFPDETITQLHNALVDNIVCLRCYYKMRHNVDLNEKYPSFKNRFIELTS